MIKITHNSGFFSCCSYRLFKIIEYFNKKKCLPETIDTTNSFTWYKPENRLEQDIITDYFTLTADEIEYNKNIELSQKVFDVQFYDYKKLYFDDFIPIINKYFTPSDEILNLVSSIEQKYNLPDYKNLCVLFYRGNDKMKETIAPTYSDFFRKALELKRKNEKIKFLLQSDETEFLNAMLKLFPDSIVFNDEIRHINKNCDTVDRIYYGNNYNFSKNFLAITIIMSKCSHIICTSGNCSLWIMFFRGNANNIIQYLNQKEHIYGVPNPHYDKNKTNFWIE
jgi:hypothetical protein